MCVEGKAREVAGVPEEERDMAAAAGNYATDVARMKEVMGDLINLYTAEDDIVKMKEIVSKAQQTRDMIEAAETGPRQLIKGKFSR